MHHVPLLSRKGCLLLLLIIFIHLCLHLLFWHLLGSAEQEAGPVNVLLDPLTVSPKLHHILRSLRQWLTSLPLVLRLRSHLDHLGFPGLFLLLLLSPLLPLLVPLVSLSGLPLPFLPGLHRAN